MKRIHFLGIGSNSFGKLSTSSFSLVLSEQTHLLVDCGPDIPRQIKNSSIDFTEIRYCILTHRHLDHCLGLPYLLFGRNMDVSRQMRVSSSLAQENYDITIIAEKEIFGALLDLLNLCHPDLKKLLFNVKFIDITEFLEDCLEIENHKIKFYLMNHTVPAYGFIIKDSSNKSIAYSTDTLPSIPFCNAASNVDVLIHEAMVSENDQTFSEQTKHSTITQAGKFILDANPKKAFLMHIRPEFLPKIDDFQNMASMIARQKVEYPLEGEVFEF